VAARTRADGIVMILGSMANGQMITCFVFLAVLLGVLFWRILPRSDIPAPFALPAIPPSRAATLVRVIVFRDGVRGRSKNVNEV